MLKILIIEDHQVVADGISTILKSNENVGEVIHSPLGMLGISLLRDLGDFDMVLLDINLPDSNGIDLCKEIRTEFPEIGIIALSTYHQSGIIHKMLENGANSYLLKNAGADELFTALEKVASKQKYLPTEINDILKVDDENVHLKTPVFTKREKEVLIQIAEGLTNQKIADKLFISPLTVISHRKSLLQKTQTKNTAQMIKYCFEYGLLI